MEKEAEAETTPKREKPGPVFEYPRLGLKETWVNWLVTAGILIYAWYCVFIVSWTYDWEGGYRSFRYNDWPIFGRLRKDTTNYEWDKWVPMVHKLLPLFCLHSLIFNLSEKVLCPRYKWLWEAITLAYGIASCCYVFTWPVVLASIVHGFMIFIVARLTGLKLAAWLSVAPLLWLNLNRPYVFLPDTTPYFLTLMFSSYQLITYLGYSLEMLKGNTLPENQGFFRAVYRMYYFVFYLPFTITLIVLYPEFERQLAERAKRVRDWKQILWFAGRITFWYLFIETVFLHFFYFDAICQDIEILEIVDEGTLVSLGYATGQFFHLKYVVMFGVPTVFALLDNMQPYPGPICISRVSLYSKMWRSFDRGLYFFFKEYIFLPICRPTFSTVRKIFGVLISYSFVVLWHGLTHQYLVWIAINVFELFLEQSSKALYLVPTVRRLREKYLSDRNFRRILAVLQCCPFAFALYSTFYFLTGSEPGWVFVDRIFWGETVTFQWPFALLVFLGYFYNNCCMDCDIRDAEKKLREKEKEEKLD